MSVSYGYFIWGEVSIVLFLLLYKFEIQNGISRFSGRSFLKKRNVRTGQRKSTYYIQELIISRHRRIHEPDTPKQRLVVIHR
jgi:hypothetical protein